MGASPLAVAQAVMLAAALTGCASAPDKQPTPSGETLTLLSHFDQWRGTNYQYGGTTSAGLDCSAFIQLTYANVFGQTLPRTTREQVTLGEHVERSALRAGDLVFFKTGATDRHAGIYVGGGDFIHASSSQGVTRSSLSTPYWRRHWWTARRVPR